ncbi:MAG: DUF4143 domain-containing protein [Bacteriovorax sp.]|nr:DUF4143 domain-containing protein [Bacteriovorax sp.]
MKTYKLLYSKNYFLDVGLVNAMMRLDLEVIDQEMKNNFNIKGMIAEQFVAQHLAFTVGPELVYWLRDKGSQKGEIDFIIQKKDKSFQLKLWLLKLGVKIFVLFSRERN